MAIGLAANNPSSLRTTVGCGGVGIGVGCGGVGINVGCGGVDNGDTGAAHAGFAAHRVIQWIRRFTNKRLHRNGLTESVCTKKGLMVLS